MKKKTCSNGSKGRLILQSFFCVSNFFQKTNKNTLHGSKNEFISSFFGRIHGLTICFWNYLSFNSATDSKWPRLSFYFMESYQCIVLFTFSFSRFWFIKTCLWKTLHHCHLLSCHCLGTNEAEKTSEKTLCTFWAFIIINVHIRYLYESLTLNLRVFSLNICVQLF